MGDHASCIVRHQHALQKYNSVPAAGDNNVPKLLQDLRDLFRVVLHELDKSETQQALHQLHSGQRKATAYVQEHLQFLETLPRYAGLPLLLTSGPAELMFCFQHACHLL